MDILEKTQNGGGVSGVGSIEAICLEFDELSQYSLTKEFLASLSNLRFLQVYKKFIRQVDSKDLSGDSVSILTRADRFQYYQRSNFVPTTFGPLILPELRWLSWNYFPKDFEVTNFSLRELVILDFSWSEITENLDGWSYVKLAKNLKVLNLTGCKNLRKTPGLSSFVYLERLILKSCRSLVQIDPSVSHFLKRLVFLNLKGCRYLSKLPNEMGQLESLGELLLDSTSIEEIPEWRKMEKLEILSLVNSLKKFDFLGTAGELSLVENYLIQLPKSIENFNALIELDISGSGIRKLPYSIRYMKNLKVLKMLQSILRKLPIAIGMLEKLEQLEAGVFPRGEVPVNIGKLPFLSESVLAYTEISALLQLPESLITLDFHTPSMETRPDLSNLLNLRVLKWHVRFKNPLKLEAASSSWGIGRLRMLEALDLYCPDIDSLPSDLVHLSQLKELSLWCSNLQCLPRLPTNLSWLCIKCCGSMKTTNDMSNLKALSDQHIGLCDELTENEGIVGLENLRTLMLVRLPSLAKLPDLTNLKKLKKIFLSYCTELFEIPDFSDSLEILEIHNYFKLQKLPDPSTSKNLKVSIRREWEWEWA